MARSGAAGAQAWPRVSGPQTTAGLGTLVRQKLFWLAQLEGSRNLSVSAGRQMAPVAALFDAPLPMGCVLGAHGLRQTAAQVWAGALGGVCLGPEGALLQPAQVAWGYHFGSFQRPSGAYRRSYMGHDGAVTGGAVAAALTRSTGGLGVGADAAAFGHLGANTL